MATTFYERDPRKKTLDRGKLPGGGSAPSVTQYLETISIADLQRAAKENTAVGEAIQEVVNHVRDHPNLNQLPLCQEVFGALARNRVTWQLDCGKVDRIIDTVELPQEIITHIVEVARQIRMCINLSIAITRALENGGNVRWKIMRILQQRNYQDVHIPLSILNTVSWRGRLLRSDLRNFAKDRRFAYTVTDYHTYLNFIGIVIRDSGIDQSEREKCILNYLGELQDRFKKDVFWNKVAITLRRMSNVSDDFRETISLKFLELAKYYLEPLDSIAHLDSPPRRRRQPEQTHRLERRPPASCEPTGTRGRPIIPPAPDRVIPNPVDPRAALLASGAVRPASEKAAPEPATPPRPDDARAPVAATVQTRPDPAQPPPAAPPKQSTSLSPTINELIPELTYREAVELIGSDEAMSTNADTYLLLMQKAAEEMRFPVERDQAIVQWLRILIDFRIEDTAVIWNKVVSFLNELTGRSPALTHLIKEHPILRKFVEPEEVDNAFKDPEPGDGERFQPTFSRTTGHDSHAHSGSQFHRRRGKKKG